MAKSPASYIPSFYKTETIESSSTTTEGQKLSANMLQRIDSYIENSPIVIKHINSLIDSRVDNSPAVIDHINSRVDSRVDNSPAVIDHINSRVDSRIDNSPVVIDQIASKINSHLERPDIKDRINMLITDSSSIKDYINAHIEKLKPSFATFEQEDICPDLPRILEELRVAIDNCVKKSGDAVSGQLSILKTPQAKYDAVNKEYIDWFFCNLAQKIDSKFTKNSDLDLNHYQIKNLQSPTDLNDAVTKNYVDQRLEKISGFYSVYHIFSQGQHVLKRTFFFSPGFVCPQDIHIISVGFSTSVHKFNITEKLKNGEHPTVKLYFMVNKDIKSEYPIEKDFRLGYMLKEFEEPIVFKKGENLTMTVDGLLEHSSVNISFY